MWIMAVLPLHDKLHCDYRPTNCSLSCVSLSSLSLIPLYAALLSFSFFFTSWKHEDISFRKNGRFDDDTSDGSSVSNCRFENISHEVKSDVLELINLTRTLYIVERCICNRKNRYQIRKMKFSVYIILTVYLLFMFNLHFTRTKMFEDIEIFCFRELNTNLALISFLRVI